MSNHEVIESSPQSADLDAELEKLNGESMESDDTYQPKHSTEYTPTHLAPEGTSEGVMDAEAREALQDDEKYRATDRELLRGSRALRASITEHGVKALRKLGHVGATVKNIGTFAGTREAYHDERARRAESKVTKREAQLGQIKGEGVFKDYAQNKLKKTQDKLNHHTEKRDNVTKKINARHDKAEGIRAESHQEYINKLVQRKGRALLRREARRRLRTQGASRYESFKLARKVISPSEQVANSEATTDQTSENEQSGEQADDRLYKGLAGAARLAMMSEATRHHHRKSERTLKRHEKRFDRAESKLTNATDTYAEAREKLIATNENVTELRPMVSRAKESLEASKATLENYDEDDVARIDAEEQYAAAKRTYNRYVTLLQQREAQVHEYRTTMNQQKDLEEKYQRRRRKHGARADSEARVEDATRDRYVKVSDAASTALDDLLKNTNK